MKCAIKTKPKKAKTKNPLANRSKEKIVQQKERTCRESEGTLHCHLIEEQKALTLDSKLEKTDGSGS